MQIKNCWIHGTTVIFSLNMESVFDSCRSKTIFTPSSTIIFMISSMFDTTLEHLSLKVSSFTFLNVFTQYWDT
jgi:hypothetical protein